MVKNKRRYAIITSILIMSMGNLSYAHSGRTDASGGHRDNKNKSGLGSYHYHCGGYPAHLHTNGCPYTSQGSSNVQNTPSTSNTNTTSNPSTPKAPQQPSYESLKNKANKDGYNKGYEDGYNNRSRNTLSYTGDFTDEYESGYDSGYDKGSQKLEEEIEIAKQKGYDLGSKGEKLNTVYTNEALVKAYEEGHTEGYNEYKNKTKEEYAKRGKEDASQDKPMAKFEDDVENEYKVEYIKAYEKVQEELKNKYYSMGFEDAILKKEYKVPNVENKKYIQWFKDGYDEGKSRLEREIQNAYKLGFEGEELKIDEEMTKAKEVLQESYVKGESEKKKNTTSGIVGVGAIAAVGGLVYNKKRKKGKKIK